MAKSKPKVEFAPPLISGGERFRPPRLPAQLDRKLIAQRGGPRLLAQLERFTDELDPADADWIVRAANRFATVEPQALV